MICTLAMLSLAAATVVTQSERHVERLPNGLTLVQIERTGLPLATFAMFLGRGAAHDPAGRRGLSKLALSLTWLGCGDLDEVGVLERVGELGGEYGIDVQLEYSSTWLSCLTSTAHDAFDLFADSLLAPRLDRATADRETKKEQALVAWRRNQPYYLAEDALHRALLGDHAYGRALQLGSDDELVGVTREELEASLAELLVPSTAVMFVMGPRDEKLLAKVRDRLGALPRTEPGAPIRAPRQPPNELSVRTVVRPEMGQIYLRFGAMGPAATAKDRIAHLVFERVMAAGFTSVLVDELRVNRGLVYGIGVARHWLDHPSPYSFVTSTSADKALEVLQVTFAKLREVRAGKLDDERLEAARNTLLVALAQQTVSDWGRARAEYLGHRYHGDFATFRRDLEAVRATTTQEVLAAARRYDPATFSIVLVGARDALAGIDAGTLK